MRSVFLIVATSVALLAASPAAFACSIAADPDSDEADRVRTADLAVYGKVVGRTLLSKSENTPDARYRYKLRVLKTYKGRRAKTITLLGGTNSAMCEAGLLRVGDRHGLILHGRQGPWRITITSFISKRDLERGARRRG